MIFLALFFNFVLSSEIPPPFALSAQPTSYLYPIAEAGRSHAELLTLDSLAGNLARQTPTLYRTAQASWRNDTSDSYSIWLVELENQGVTMNDTLLTAPLSEIAGAFVNSSWSYIRCYFNDTSVSIALTLAAVDDLVLVAGDDTTAAALEKAGVQMKIDVTNSTYEETITADVISKTSQTVYVFQLPYKSAYLGDWSIMQRAVNMPWGISNVTMTESLNHVGAYGAAYGWGPENDYVTTLSEHGIWVHASDWAKNLPALSNGPRQPVVAAGTSSSRYNLRGVSTGKHTVSFLMTDGDNVQWTLGPWSTSQNWYGSSQRGKVPMGWTLSPAISDLAPSAMAKILADKTDNDELVAGPSGYGYAYPTKWPEADQQSFAIRTIAAMDKFGMTAVNVLGQNDDPPICDEIVDRITPENFPGLIFYPWGGGYAALNGTAYECAEKPVITGRWSLWGNGTSGYMVGVQTMIENLKSVANLTDPSSADSYSLIPVLAWDHTYADVVEIVEALEADGRFDVVLPSEMLKRLSSAELAFY